MIILIILLISFNCNVGHTKQEQKAVRISIVRQQVFRNRGHHPENNRRVTFRMINETSKPIIVFGFKDDMGFDPTGYLIVLDSSKGEWSYPTGDNLPVRWSERSDLDKGEYVLRPGEAINFIAEMSKFEVGKHFKRTAYVSFNSDREPSEIKSEEFILK